MPFFLFCIFVWGGRGGKAVGLPPKRGGKGWAAINPQTLRPKGWGANGFDEQDLYKEYGVIVNTSILNEPSVMISDPREWRKVFQNEGRPDLDPRAVCDVQMDLVLDPHFSA